MCDVEVPEKRKRGPHLSAHTRIAAAKYEYPDGNKHPYEWKVCPTCDELKLIRRDKIWCSHRCSKMGDLNPAKQKAFPHGMTKYEYVMAHKAVRLARGKAFGCEHCGTRAKRMYHWANLTGDYWNVWDYKSLCVPCHSKMDYAREDTGNG